MLHLTSHGLLGRIHSQVENNPNVRTGAICAVASAVGLAAGKSEAFRKTSPLIVMGGGLALSMFGMTGVGDGALAAGATVLGYRYGVRGRFTKRPALTEVPATTTAAPRRK